MNQSEDYRQRVGVAVYEAVVKASAEGGEVALIQSGPAFDALMMVAAMMIASEPELQNRQALALFCERAGQMLHKQIQAVQASPEHMDQIADVKPSGPLS